MRSFKKFQAKLQEEKRKARVQILEEYKTLFWLQDRGDCLVMMDDDGRLDTDEGTWFHRFTKGNLVHFIEQTKIDIENNRYEHKGTLTVSYDGGFDLHDNIQRDDPEYIPWVAEFGFDIWNSKEGWLF
jgi:hypothetical protein